jgi:phosphoglucosamine mutase
MQLFGTSGIRRLVDDNLISLALRVGLATGKIYSKVALGRDTRTSGSALSHAVTSGLLAAGANCSDAGIIPTPTLAFLTREFEAGIMVTASHNPPQYNGLKLINPDGSAFSAEQQKQIEELVDGPTPTQTRWGKMQKGEINETAVEKHITRILEDFQERLKIKVVVDSGCGAAYFITPNMLKRLGCEVITLNCSPNGIFPHDVEPIEANLGDLMNTVKKCGADLGIAHDGDADRMMAVDNLGRFIPGDKMLAILGQACGTKTLVTTVDASLSIDEMSFIVKRTKVGDPYVSEELKRGGEFGGEPSGAWVFPALSLCPDGIYAAAKIAAIASREKLSYLVDNIPSYPMIRGNISGKIKYMDKLKEKLLAGLEPAAIETVDGLKMSFKDGWILVRPSGTEPKIRLTAEAKSQPSARQYYEKSAIIIQDYVQGYDS